MEREEISDVDSEDEKYLVRDENLLAAKLRVYGPNMPINEDE